jgi:HEAT repeat protein
VKNQINSRPYLSRILFGLLIGLGAIANPQQIFAQEKFRICTDAKIDQFIFESLVKQDQAENPDRVGEPPVTFSLGWMVSTRAPIFPGFQFKCNLEEIPALISSLTSDPNQVVRYRAAFALAQMGKNAKSAIPNLIDALKDPERDVRFTAGVALEKVGKDAVPSLIVALKDPNPVVSEEAAVALKEIGSDAKVAVPELVVLLDRPERYVRLNALTALGGISPNDAVPGLIVAFKDPDKSIRLNALISLQEIGKEARAAIPEVLLALKDPDPVIRKISANALYYLLGNSDKDVLPDLIAALKSSDDQVSFYISASFEAFGKDAVPSLISVLKDSEQKNYVRESAASALQRIGKDAKEAIPSLINALKDQNVRNNASEALVSIGKESVPALIIALKNTDVNVAVTAASTLGRIGKDAKEAIPSLITSFKASNGVGSNSSYALSKLGKMRYQH